jgi:hypothetical protein
VSVKVGVKRTGKPPKPRPATVLGVDHMARIGKAIAGPLQRSLAAGQDADGRPLAAEVDGRGDGIPGHETGALAASIAPRVRSNGKLIVAPDYRKLRYGIFLALGVDKAATRAAIAEGRMRKRREYKSSSDRRQVPRPFMGMDRETLRRVEVANTRRFADWLEGKLQRQVLVEVGGA